MNFLFAWRYFRSKKSTNAINVISWISVTAIAVGCAALIVILSVFNGFEELVKGLYADFYTDVRIIPATGKTFHITDAQLQTIKTIPGVAVTSLVAEEKALLVNSDYQTIVLVKGVDQYYSATNRINTHIKRGKFQLGDIVAPQLVLGAGIENAVGADIERGFYPLTLYTPNKKARFGSAEGLSSYQVTAAGSFLVQQDFDNKYVFTNLAFLKYMLNMDADEYSGIEIKVNGKAATVKSLLQKQLGNTFQVQTRYEQNKSLYAVMQLEKWVIYGILSLILVVAAFNMIGALTMLVLEKQKDIAVLQALGATAQSIQSIFMTEGLLLAGLGAGFGIIIGAFVCWLQIRFKLIKLGGDTFIINYYPVKVLPLDFLLITTTIALIAFIAAYLPARKASNQLFTLKSNG